VSNIALRTDSAPAPVGAYSQAITNGNLLFTSGMGPLEPGTGRVIGEDVASQTATVLDHLEAVLAEVGMGLADVVKATVHLQNLNRDFAEFDRVYRARMVEPFPARTTVGSTLNNILVEIDFVALRT
jgi:2-iminobutanoate/2-iminopropanoate deaminase